MNFNNGNILEKQAAVTVLKRQRWTGQTIKNQLNYE